MIRKHQSDKQNRWKAVFLKMLSGFCKISVNNLFIRINNQEPLAVCLFNHLVAVESKIILPCFEIYPGAGFFCYLWCVVG